MSSLADSRAVVDLERLLVQHQAALTLLQGMLSDPACREVPWLDLACGKGQIIAHLRENLSDSERQKIRLVGYDIENAHSKQARRLAESLGLGAASFEIGDLNRFWENSGTAGPWRFITLTNTIHEIAPASLAQILVCCVDRLTANGCLFLYDMERLPAPELGAVPWSASEMKAILIALCRALGCDAYEPAVGRWEHKTCDGWNAQLHRSHMNLPADYSARISDATRVTADRIRELLDGRLARASAALESLANCGSRSDEEAAERVTLLYEFWAVSRALGEET